VVGVFAADDLVLPQKNKRPTCPRRYTFGTPRTGGVDEATSHQIMSTFIEAGGNFIDTANAYGDGESKQISAFGDFGNVQVSGSIRALLCSARP